MTDYTTKPIPGEPPRARAGERPWGWFKQYAINLDAVTVSIMAVRPGERLSLQAHSGRAELWIVLDDGGTVQVGDEVREARAGDEFWIPANARHRFTGPPPGGKEVRVLEVGFGNWQQEDVARDEDDYGRPAQGE